MHAAERSALHYIVQQTLLHETPFPADTLVTLTLTLTLIFVPEFLTLHDANATQQQPN
jgi:hypothetical protein